ncbi:TerD family protein [Frondihabitans cladoniiphilus]|uniref:Calcium homeostasis/redox stress adaptation protein n=1 Tax=Frondihabitans cladoniiphilus TaxID=715785 RepID=A0ABP8W7Y2_9MICO
MATMVAGANAALTAENPGLSSVVVALGWEQIESRGPQAELVPLTVLCGSDGKALSNEHLVFFNQLVSEDGSVEFVDSGDAEEIDVDLSGVPAEVAKIVFIVYVDPELRGPGTFASIRSAFIRIATPAGVELVRFTVSAADNRSINAMIFGELYRHRDEWKFRALGQGYTTGLAGVAADFRIDF